MEEHIVSVKITTDEEDLQYVIKLESPLPLFKTKRCHPAGIQIVSMGKEAAFYVKPNKGGRKLRKELLKAQKRYKAILALREHRLPYNPKVNLTHKI